MLEKGTKVPEFVLSDKDGNEVSLSSFLGRKVVLYFYPRDNTPGCSRQACAFAESFEEFKNLNAAVIGISKDSVSSHVKFAEKYNLPFVLLSDPDKKAKYVYKKHSRESNKAGSYLYKYIENSLFRSSFEPFELVKTIYLI